MEMQWIVGFAPFLMVMFIVWIVTRSKMEEKRLAATAEGSAEKAAQYASRVQQLEDRVQVLERIVTDSGYNVATQIEALRDTKTVEETGSGVAMDFGQKENAR